MPTIAVPTSYYQQFDVDFSRDVPAEGFGGWKRASLPLSTEHTAIVSMHAWDCGTREQYPGWHRVEDYIPRADAIIANELARLLAATRASAFPLIHVAALAYADRYPGYRRAFALAGPEPEPPAAVAGDPVLDQLRAFRDDHVFVGRHNAEDVRRGWEAVDFAPAARPVGDEWVVATTHQLHALCRQLGVNHLIYAGFAINWCLLMSPGGMHDMAARGVMCSAVRQAVTAVENRETARTEANKEEGLWRTSVAFGFVYDLEDLLAALRAAPRQTEPPCRGA